MEQLHRNPIQLGYHAGTWTVAQLDKHLKLYYGLDITELTLRRCMKQMGLWFKRSRYVYSENDSDRAQIMKAFSRKLSHMPPEAVLLFEDETILKPYSAKRGSWSMSGEQASFVISVRNALREIFCCIKICIG